MEIGRSGDSEVTLVAFGQDNAPPVSGTHWRDWGWLLIPSSRGWFPPG